MRELKVVGLDADGKNIICEGDIPGEQFKLPADARLREAMRGDDIAQIGRENLIQYRGW